MAIQLFKIITTRDEIVVGTADGSDAAALAKALVSQGSLGLTQYAVRRAADGSLEQGPAPRGCHPRQRQPSYRALCEPSAGRRLTPRRCEQNANKAY